MERQREDTLHQYTMEKEDQAAAMERLKDELTNELAILQRDRDDSLLLAENEKQQVSCSGGRCVCGEGGGGKGEGR